jgi:hypothetical protein
MTIRKIGGKGSGVRPTEPESSPPKRAHSGARDTVAKSKRGRELLANVPAAGANLSAPKHGGVSVTGASRGPIYDEAGRLVLVAEQHPERRDELSRALAESIKRGLGFVL